MEINLKLLTLCALQEIAAIIDRDLEWFAAAPNPTLESVDQCEEILTALNDEIECRL